MTTEIAYTLSEDGLAFHANCDKGTVGHITFVRVGIDKIIIDHTEVHEDYLDNHIDDGLVDCVVKLARQQRRKIMCLCPIARAVFNRHPDYDDIRLINMH